MMLPRVLSVALRFFPLMLLLLQSSGTDRSRFIAQLTTSNSSAHVHSHTCSRNEPLLVVVPDLLMGLTNQIMTFIEGIYLGIAARRNICIGGFYGNMYTVKDVHAMWNTPDVNVPKLTPAHLFLSIKHLNSIFKEDLQELSICVCDPLEIYNSTCVITDGRGGVCRLNRKKSIAEYESPTIGKKNPVVEHVLSPTVAQMHTIIVGSPFHLFQNYWDRKQVMLSRIRFRQYYYDIVTRETRHQFYPTVNISSQMEHKYTAIHLRVENDFLSCTHPEWVPHKTKAQKFLLLSGFLNFVRSIIVNRGEHIVVQTGLTVSDDLYFSLSYLRHYFPNTVLLDKSNLRRELRDPRLAMNKEKWNNTVSQVDAIFDLVSATLSNRFIGSKLSTFSMLINARHTAEHKEAHLYNEKRPTAEELAVFELSDEFKLMCLFDIQSR